MLLAESTELPFEERDRQLDKLDGQIAAINKRLDRLPESLVVEPERREMIPNPAYDEIQRKLDEIQIENRRLAVMIEHREQAIETKRGQLDQVVQCEGPHIFFEMEIEDAKRGYDQLDELAAKIEALNKLDVEGEANLTVLQEPILPVGKQGPRRSKLLLQGLGVGMAIGVTLALARQFLDGHVRYPETIERALGIPVLAVVPELSKLRRA